MQAMAAMLLRRAAWGGMRPGAAARSLHAAPWRAALGRSDMHGIDWSDEDVGEVKRWLPGFTLQRLRAEKLEMRFSRSSGPGGQNVNKVNTKADIRFKLDEHRWLPLYTQQRLRALFAGRINKEGELVVTSDVHRTQRENLDDCYGRLYDMIRTASETPGETSAVQKQRVEQMRDKNEEKRLQSKQFKSQKKQSRRADDD